jgi:sporulation protein YlmC with PRC-barrel domain
MARSGWKDDSNSASRVPPEIPSCFTTRRLPDGSSAANIVGSGISEGPGPEVMTAATLDGTQVISSDGEDVGKIPDIIPDMRNGRIAYSVLPERGFLGMGMNLHAIPVERTHAIRTQSVFALASLVSVAARRIKDDPGFDRDHWPLIADANVGHHGSTVLRPRPVLARDADCRKIGRRWTV